MSADPKEVRRHLLGKGEGIEEISRPVSTKQLTALQIRERRARWAALVGDGERVEEIAREEGLDVSRIRRGILALVRQQEEKGLAAREQKRAVALAKNQMLQDEALDCFYRSMEGKEVAYSEEMKAAIQRTTKNKRKRGERPSGQGTGRYKRYTRVESSVGDVRYLQLLAELMKEENKLNGVYPRDEAPVDDLALLTPEERMKRVESLLEQARLSRAQRLSVSEGAAMRVGSIDISAHEGMPPVPVPESGPESEPEPPATPPGPEIDLSLKPDIE